MKRWSFGLLVLTLVSACATGRRVGPSPFDRAEDPWTAQDVDLTVVVRNNHWLSMRVWANWPGRHVFLGDVEAGSSATFRLPAPEARRFPTVRLFADPEGSVDQVLSDPIDVRRGHRIEWTLRKVLANSRATVM